MDDTKERKVDLLAEAGELLKRYSSHFVVPPKEPNAILASAILAVAGELRDIHNMLADVRDSNRSIGDSLAALVAELQREVDRLTRQNGIAVDTLNSHLAAVGHVSNVTETPVDWWADLDPETNDYRISLDAGRRKFREVPKQQRLLLVQAFARHIGGGVLPRQLEFDTYKPDWMPGGGGLAVTFCCNWSELLTITPAEVAP